MAQMISVVRYDITKNNVTTGLVKSRFPSMMDAQLYIKNLANRSYLPVLKQTKNTLTLDKWTNNMGTQRMIVLFKIVKSASIPLNPKEVEKIKEEVFIKES